MTVDYKTYMTEKMDFFSEHNHDYFIETSPMDDYGVYYKTYCFEDGAIWYERMSPHTVPVTVEVNGCTCRVEVKLFRTEYWSTESPSKYYFEQF